MNNLPKFVAQQRRGRASNPRLLDRKSDALPLSHRATPKLLDINESCDYNLYYALPVGAHESYFYSECAQNTTLL